MKQLKDEINLKNIKITKIKKYFEATNDVIEIEINDKVKAILKIENKYSHLSKEMHNLNIINYNKLYSKVPNILETGEVNDKKYEVLEYIKGDKLPKILKKDSFNKNLYLYNYGRELGIIHKIPINNFDIAKMRNINFIPKEEDYSDILDSNIKEYLDYVNNNKPEIVYNTFVHGDFHYGNLLWNHKEIIGVIDLEYSGIGFREQDIAWALIYRKNQEFLDNVNDIRAFLEGYKSVNTYSKKHLKWTLINGYVHFYLQVNDKKYRNKILKLLRTIDSIF